MSLTMLITMLVCFAFSVSVDDSIGLAASIGLAISDPSRMVLLPKEMFSALDKFPLAAIPVFILAGIANVSIWTIGMAMSVGYGAEHERPVYIGLANTLVAPATILAPIVGGLIAGAKGFSATFAWSAVISLGVVLILATVVRDPVPHLLQETYEPLS